MVSGRVSSDGSYVHISPEAVAAFIRDGGGPVMADLTRRATNVQNVAKQRVGKRTRRLERSIVKRAGVDTQGPFVMVVTEGVPYGYWHHEGNGRHPGNPFLRSALPFGAR